MDNIEQKIHCVIKNSFRDGCKFAFECVAQNNEMFSPVLKDVDFILRLIDSKAKEYADNIFNNIENMDD